MVGCWWLARGGWFVVKGSFVRRAEEKEEVRSTRSGLPWEFRSSEFFVRRRHQRGGVRRSWFVRRRVGVGAFGRGSVCAEGTRAARTRGSPRNAGKSLYFLFFSLGFLCECVSGVEASSFK